MRAFFNVYLTVGLMVFSGLVSAKHETLENQFVKISINDSATFGIGLNTNGEPLSDAPWINHPVSGNGYEYLRAKIPFEMFSIKVNDQLYANLSTPLMSIKIYIHRKTFSTKPVHFYLSY